MTRLAMSVMFGQLGHTAMAAQSQIPLRVGDCVEAVNDLHFFYKEESEYERTHAVSKGQAGTLLNLADESIVEFLDPKTREPVVSGGVFPYQFTRVPWKQGQLTAAGTTKCLTAVHNSDHYPPVLKMSECATTDDGRWSQQFTFNRDDCGARPIRYTQDPSKCVDAIHPDKVLLTDCNGADGQQFQMRCHIPSGQASKNCVLLGMGGRKDMCLWWDEGTGDADLRLRRCEAPNPATGFTNGITPREVSVTDLQDAATRV